MYGTSITGHLTGTPLLKTFAIFHTGVLFQHNLTSALWSIFCCFLPLILDQVLNDSCCVGHLIEKMFLIYFMLLLFWWIVCLCTSNLNMFEIIGIHVVHNKDWSKLINRLTTFKRALKSEYRFMTSGYLESINAIFLGVEVMIFSYPDKPPPR